MAQRDLGTYQMLWDCPFCGATKLLGVTHRHCPGCGAPQDPARRYFPSEADKVKVEDHRFSGADKVCAACSTPNGAAASNCGNCGSALDGAKEAAKATERQASAEAGASISAEEKARKVAAARAALQKADPPRKSGSGCVVVIVLLILGIIGFICLNTFWKKEGSFEVTGHSWSRSVDIETFGPDQTEGWCDAMPSGAKDVSRSSKQRSTNKVPDGETCVTKQVDQGDGTFKEVESCSPKFKEEPVNDDWCRYEVDRWKKSSEAMASGKSLGEKPVWPEPRVRGGSGVGAERLGGRSETYTVKLKGSDGDAASCDLPETTWQSMAVGSRYTGGVSVLTGSLDCGDLKPAK